MDPSKPLIVQSDQTILLEVNHPQYSLVRDRKGMWWDLLLYVPTVIALLSIGAKLWFGPYQNYSYVAIFAGCFFLLQAKKENFISKIENLLTLIIF